MADKQKQPQEKSPFAFFELLMEKIDAVDNRMSRFEEILKNNNVKDPYPHLPETLRITGASEILGWAKQTIYEKVMKKLIPFHKVGKILTFSKQELIEWKKNSN